MEVAPQRAVVDVSVEASSQSESSLLRLSHHVQESCIDHFDRLLMSHLRQTGGTAGKWNGSAGAVHLDTVCVFNQFNVLFHFCDSLPFPSVRALDSSNPCAKLARVVPILFRSEEHGGSIEKSL